MKKTFLNIATVAITTLSLFSCHKKSEDPTPVQDPTLQAPTTKPVVDSTKKEVVITPKDSPVVVIVEKKLEIIATSPKQILSYGNNHSFSLEKMVFSDGEAWELLTVSSNNPDVVVSKNGKEIFVSKLNTNIVYAGDIVITTTLKSGVKTVKQNITVQVGTNEHVATYNMLKDYFGKKFDHPNLALKNLYIYNNGNIKSDANGNFYSDSDGNGDPDGTHATYIINDNGNVYMDVQGVKVEYKVEIYQLSGKYRIKFTNVVNEKLIYTSELVKLI